MSVRLLREADLERLFALRQISFLDRSDFSTPAMRAHHVARLHYTYGHFEEDKLTSAAVCHPFETFVAGRRVAAGGLASVLSAPETRRRGFVRELLKHILSDLKDKGVGWALEYPFDPRFYARYGFATVPTGSEVTVPAERLFRGPSPDAERFSGNPEDVLEPIYNAWAQHYSLTLCRDTTARPSWSRILEDTVCYLLEDAYMIFELEAGAAGQTLTVHDYAFTTPAGRECVFGFVGSFYGQVDRISLHLPNDEPLAFDLQRYHTNELPALQARIVDVTAALGSLTSDTEIALNIHVEDTFCPWNDSTFRLELDPSSTQVNPTDAEADMALDIATLTRLVTGALTPAAALHLGLASGDARAVRAVGALSGGYIPFMPSSDYF